MGKITKTLTAIALSAVMAGAMAQGQRLGGSSVVSYNTSTNLPYFIKLNPSQQMRQESFNDWAVYALNLPATSILKPYETFTDELGYTHVRHRQYHNGYPVEGTQVISHSADGKVTMVNGDYFLGFSAVSAASLTEADALASALKKVNAAKYMWEDKEWEAMKRAATNNPEFTYFPKGELVYVHKKDADYSPENMRLAYKFNIYAQEPLYRANVFVDAASGEILDEHNLIHAADVVGQGVTMYSGTKTMTSDNNGGTYRLRETGRGNGIQTYDMNNGTSYGSAVDFTNGSSTWNLAGNSKAASDAHWGAEMTYDYFLQKHSRNSIDGNGFMLVSYMHYSTNYTNAFWNGQEMTYGDGNGSSFTVMTALDVCGHEITHGLVSATAGLVYQNESGALNESFADIFGNSIENFARPSQWSWRIGEDITTSGNGIRSMSNPGSFGDPDTYMAGSYYTGTGDNGGVHTNSGVSNFWYYLLTIGGTGTNDLGNSYSVSGQGWTKSSQIAFRGLTVYFTSSTGFTNARTLTEQAASDLFGACSPELTATSNAWYAVGVGGVPTTGAPSASFSTGAIATCSMPVSVTFNNTSAGAQSYAWNFGDGGTSTQANPSHTYTVAGTYTVTLVATGCGGGSTSTYTQTVNIGSVGANLPLTEGFEGLTNIPSGWTLGNPDNDAAWEINSTVARTGTKSMGFNNCDGNGSGDMTGKVDWVYTKNYNFSNTTNASMTFDLAYALLIYQSTPYPDQLKVNVSTNCGTSWTTLYNKSGTTLATAPSYTSIASCWVPSGASQWRNESINLNAYSGQANVMFAFENTSNWGTWVYIDNINITGTTGVSINQAEGVSVYPNPAHNNFSVKADDNISSVRVIDMLGKTVALSFPEEKQAHMDISSLPAGVYFVKVSAGNAQKLVKLIKE